MNVELSMDEASVLREILEHHLGDMSAEISHTDNPEFRSLLRERRDHMKSVRDKLSDV